MITNKFGDHLPLYRQEAILARSGQPIARSTTCGWLAACAALVLPLYNLLKDRVLAGKCVNTDDTPVPVLDPGRGKTRAGRLWVYVNPAQRYTVFDYTPTHSRDGPLRFFGNYAGYIQADAYSGYDVLFKPKGEGTPGPTELGCWAHVRRKFVEAQTSDALRSVTAVAFIRRLYEVEHAAEALDATARRARRQEQSVPILDQLKIWLHEQQGQVLPKSPLGEAIGYPHPRITASVCQPAGRGWTRAGSHRPSQRRRAGPRRPGVLLRARAGRPGLAGCGRWRRRKLAASRCPSRLAA